VKNFILHRPFQIFRRKQSFAHYSIVLILRTHETRFLRLIYEVVRILLP